MKCLYCGKETKNVIHTKYGDVPICRRHLKGMSNEEIASLIEKLIELQNWFEKWEKYYDSPKD